MKSYLELVDNVLENGEKVPTRTGIDALSILGIMFKHDMAEGFPLLTTKKVHFHSIKVELEFFLHGLTSKKWLQERNCNIWNEWANPEKIPKTPSVAERLEKQKNEDDLGPIYGSQWRNFTGREENADQLKNVVQGIKNDPNSRKLLVSAWNPTVMHKMALPPCHVLFNVNVRGKKLNLTWYQRSCDLMLGIPFNIASYALLLHLLAKETKLQPGQLTGMLNDVHIYENHIQGARVQLSRKAQKLPAVKTNNFSSIFRWKHTDTEIFEYTPNDLIKFPIAV